MKKASLIDTNESEVRQTECKELTLYNDSCEEVIKVIRLPDDPIR